MTLLELGFGQDDSQKFLPISAWKLIAVVIEFRSYVPDLSAEGNLVILFLLLLFFFLFF